MSRTFPRVFTRRGFTLLELMLVVAIIGTISAIALPVFMRYQHRSKTAEVSTNLGSLRIAEESFFTEHGVYRSADPEPALIPGPAQADFNSAASDYAALGWTPEGRVYFSYAVNVSADGTGVTADAAADIDGDGIVQLWGYTKSDGSGAFINGTLGCTAAVLTPTEIGRCTLDQSIF